MKVYEFGDTDKPGIMLFPGTYCYWKLRWMMDNIFIRTDPARNIKADKEKSTEKIDGAVAAIMGLDRAIRCGMNTGASVYDERGILFI